MKLLTFSYRLAFFVFCFLWMGFNMTENSILLNKKSISCKKSYLENLLFLKSNFIGIGAKSTAKCSKSLLCEECIPSNNRTIDVFLTNPNDFEILIVGLSVNIPNLSINSDYKVLNQPSTLPPSSEVVFQVKFLNNEIGDIFQNTLDMELGIAFRRVGDSLLHRQIPLQYNICEEEVNFINIFPNPAIKDITLTYQSQEKKLRGISIFTERREEIIKIPIHSYNGEYSRTIDISKFRKGRYWCSFIDERGNIQTLSFQKF